MRKDTPAALATGPVRHALEAELIAARRRGITRPRVVDVGGGSGVWAVPLAAEGCLVTVVEPNPNAIATLQRRADEEGVRDRITVIADDSDALTSVVPAGSADLVLAHELLEVVDDPAKAVAGIAQILSEEGAASILVANRHAAVLHRALAGKPAEARALLSDPDGVLASDDDFLRRRFDAEGLRALLSSAGLQIVVLQGDAVVSDITDAGESALADFELDAATEPTLRAIASRLHAIARRPR